MKPKLTSQLIDDIRMALKYDKSCKNKEELFFYSKEKLHKIINGDKQFPKKLGYNMGYKMIGVWVKR